jgi:hypothetical protein
MHRLTQGMPSTTKADTFQVSSVPSNFKLISVCSDLPDYIPKVETIFLSSEMGPSRVQPELDQREAGQISTETVQSQVV